MDRLGLLTSTVLWLCKTNLMLKRIPTVSVSTVPEGEVAGGRGERREEPYLSFD